MTRDTFNVQMRDGSISFGGASSFAAGMPTGFGKSFCVELSAAFDPVIQDLAALFTKANIEPIVGCSVQRTAAEQLGVGHDA